MLVREIEEQAHIMSEYEHKTSLNFTMQFVSKRRVKMKAACSVREAGTYQEKCMAFMCVCVLRVTCKMDGTVEYEATDPPRTSDITWFTSIHYE